ncbi:MAG TPA: lysophospholipid acyltransferase family protein [Actinomycetota bacterium]|nr:lysophospholipid acyltransferase family protein [Actinomycetota bacterium]
MPEAQVVPINRDEPDRCRAVTVRGQPCRNRAVEGSMFCRIHQPSSGSRAPTGGLPPSLGSLAEGDVTDIFEFLRRRMRGEYEIDVFGFDRELTELLLPLIRPLVRSYFRVDVIGNERIPSTGPALLAANHAGTIPLDGVVLRGVVWEHEPHRHVRELVADLGFTIPFFSQVVRKTGATVACVEDTMRLLKAGELVAVFPEGFKGVGKRFKERYRLQRFGRGGFVEVAMQARAPIVPVAIVGSEETYPMVANLRPLARLLGLPYFPITAQFPLLGPLGLLPIPSKWVIEFCEPVETAHLPEDAASDPMAVFEVTDQVRQSIQRTLLKNLRLRRSILG